ncbi:MAG: hypothetical protein ACYS8X_14085, partial [Planctomycetota bacterium]
MPKETSEQVSKREIQELEVTRKTLLASLFAYTPVAAKGITYWEELTCVGFNPERSELQAVVSVKRSTGYSGGLCSQGSPEYVRFFVDWGSGFEDAGLTSFRAHDISDLPPGPQHPLQYLVQLTLADEEHRRFCKLPVLPKVRAVLSWNAMPSLDPNQVPYFGNTMDVDVQLEPNIMTLAVLAEEGLLSKKATLLDKVDLAKPLATLPPTPVPWSQLVEAYHKAEVPDHRLVYEAVYPMVKPTALAPVAPAQKDLSIVQDLNIDLSQVVDVLTLQSQANTTYEEVVCAGLNTPLDTLGAVIHVKKPCGYCGNLCQAGSREYVAFWADWNNDGAYDAYLGTATVEVHDIGSIPSGGLYYGVELPVNLLPHLKGCHDPNIIRIRAVLSWAVPPSTTDPNDLNYWGNRLDVVVQVRPGVPSTELMDLLYTIGSVGVDDFSPTTHLAYPSVGVLDPTNCSAPAKDRPLGGRVTIRGRIYNTGLP